MILNVAMVAAGIAAVFWGIPASHRLPAPFDVVAAVVVLAGLIVALFGTLLIVVPGFFHG